MTGFPARIAEAARHGALARHRLQRIGLALAIAGAVLLGSVSRGVEAAHDVPGPVAIEGSAAPAYEFVGFRWKPPVVPVYYTWEGGSCVFAGNNFTGPTTTIPEHVLLENLQASIAEINTQLRGGLALQLSGLATRAELCSTDTSKSIVVGFGAIATTGQALGYGDRGSGTYSATRVFITAAIPFVCATEPAYRNLQHTMTHELLHAIGLGHSSDASAIMAPTFVECRAPYTMQSDDIAAINALYPPKLPPPTFSAVTASPTPTRTPVLSAATPTGSLGFAGPVVFSAVGQSLTVFPSGTFDDLEAAARGAAASGVWVQDARGTFRLFVVGGPVFLRDQFRAAFPNGLPAHTAVTLVR